MIKIPKDMIISKIKEKTNLTDSQLQTKVKDKLDQLSGLISEEGALHIIANELGVKIMEEPGKLQIKNVLAGMRNVEVAAKVVKIYEVREFDKNNRKGKVGNFLVGDSTGVMRVVAWNDKAELLSKLNEQDTVKIIDGYARDNRGKTEIHLGDKTKVMINPEGAKEIEVKPISQRKRIQDLGENEQDVEIMGTIVQIFDPRFFTIDPESGKRAVEKDGKFYVGDEQIEKTDYSYVTNLFLDDGTDNIRVVLWKNQTQNLFGMDHEKILSNQNTGFEEIKNDMFGKIVKFRGRTNKNEMFDRVEFIASFVDAEPDPDKEISRLKKELDEQPEEKAEEKILEEKPQAAEIKKGSEPESKPEPKPAAKEEKVAQVEPAAAEKKAEEVQAPSGPAEEEPIKLQQAEFEQKKIEPSQKPEKPAAEPEHKPAEESVPEAASEEVSDIEDIEDIEEISDLDSI